MPFFRPLFNFKIHQRPCVNITRACIVCNSPISANHSQYAQLVDLKQLLLLSFFSLLLTLSCYAKKVSSNEKKVTYKYQFLHALNDHVHLGHQYRYATVRFSQGWWVYEICRILRGGYVFDTCFFVFLENWLAKATCF